MKVLHLLASNSFSGAENVVCTIIKSFENEIDMIYCSPLGTIKSTLEKKQIKYKEIRKLNYNEVRKIVKEYKPDIIHAHDYNASIIATLFSKKCKIISHIHGNNKKMNSFNVYSLIYLCMSKFINDIIWVSDSSLDGFYFNTKIRSKSKILYNVIDQNEIYKKTDEFKCNRKYDLIFLGRIGYPKNPERLIEIIKIIKKCIPNISIAIVGSGPDSDKIKKLVSKYGLKKNIYFYGYQHNPYPILKESKLLIMTSIYEGTPMCVLEAQCLGKPVVSTPVDGIKKIIENNKNGYLSDKNEEICSFIIDILKNNNKYIMMSEKSINFFTKYNNLNKYKKEIKKIYEK